MTQIATITERKSKLRYALLWHTKVSTPLQYEIHWHIPFKVCIHYWAFNGLGYCKTHIGQYQIWLGMVKQYSMIQVAQQGCQNHLLPWLLRNNNLLLSGQSVLTSQRYVDNLGSQQVTTSCDFVCSEALLKLFIVKELPRLFAVTVQRYFCEDFIWHQTTLIILKLKTSQT